MQLNNNNRPIVKIPINDIISDAYLHFCDIKDFSNICKNICIDIYYYNYIPNKKIVYFISKEEDLTNSVGQIDYFGLNYLNPFIVISTMEKRQTKQIISKYFDWVEDKEGLSLFKPKKNDYLKDLLKLSVGSSEITLDKVFRIVDNTVLSL